LLLLEALTSPFFMVFAPWASLDWSICSKHLDKISFYAKLKHLYNSIIFHAKLQVLYHFNQCSTHMTFLQLQKIPENLKNRERIKSAIKKIDHYTLLTNWLKWYSNCENQTQLIVRATALRSEGLNQNCTGWRCLFFLGKIYGR
jgi:hypothetical protein